MLRVLYISRPTLFTSPGGDTIQMLKTKEYLERNYDVGIVIQPDFNPIDFKEFDLIHFFNIIRPQNILPHINSGIPYVISPIYVDYSEYDQEVRGGAMAKISKTVGKGNTEYLKSIARWIKNGENPGSAYFLLHGYNQSIQKILSGCSVLLPNSAGELRRLEMYFSIDCSAIIVPNAVDTSVFDYKPEIKKEGIVCVARIEGIKNQLNLIRAVNKTELELTLIGKAAPNHIHYYNTCKKEAGDRVKFIDHISQEALVKHYRKAKIHAMVSWFETTGLSSLEAAACGCNIVISDKGDQRDYFKEDAFYCDPENIESIKQALLKAGKVKKPDTLMQRIKTQYSWVKTAEKTFEAYLKAID